MSGRPDPMDLLAHALGTVRAVRDWKPGGTPEAQIALPDPKKPPRPARARALGPAKPRAKRRRKKPSRGGGESRALELPTKRLDRDALEVVRRLQRADYTAYLVGGCVRDLALGLSPKDFDVATDARPEDVRAVFRNSRIIGRRFRLAHVYFRGGKMIEVSTFRALVEQDPDDDLLIRNDNVFGSEEEDAQRRDFTINGLFEDPETGEVLDHVGGLPDLESRLIRAIGDPEARFREDRLRILRAVRFAVQLGFAIEPRTFDAVRSLAPLVQDVSAERIRDELIKLLLHGRGAGLRLLRKAGLLELVLPEIAAMVGVPHPPQWHPEGDVFVHTCLVLDGVDLDDLATRHGVEDEASRLTLLLSALLHDVSKPDTFTRDDDGRVRFNGHEALGRKAAEDVLARLKLPRKIRDRVTDLVGQHMKFGAVEAMKESKLRRFLGQPDAPLHLALHAADSGASHGRMDALAFCRRKLEAYGNEPVLPPPLLGGRDLIEAGYAPGPRLGKILAWLRDLQLEGEVTDRDDAVRRVRDEWPTEAPES